MMKRANPERRICAQGCGTVLNSYNKSDTCAPCWERGAPGRLESMARRDRHRMKGWRREPTGNPRGRPKQST